MENLSIYDLLVGCFVFKGDRPEEVEESYLKNISEDDKLRNSIIENLQMVLRSRGGTVRHLPDFGIPDIRKAYFEQSLDSVPKQIEKMIERYEPRLEAVRCRLKRAERDKAEKDLRIEVEIRAKIKETRGREIFLTEFSTTGWLRVISQQSDKKG